MKRYFQFEYEGEVVTWSFQRIDTSTWVDNKDISTQVFCEHPTFLKCFGGHPNMVATSLTYLLSKGKQVNNEFFEAMQQSYWSQPYKIQKQTT
jgi:hypothetical protein